MLDAFIIDELKRREREGRHDDERPVLEIPIPEYDNEDPLQDHAPEPTPDRGVVIIDFSV